MKPWEREYRRKTPKSKKMFTRSVKLHVNGVSHNIRYFEPYPFVTESAAGRRLTDIDSNMYTDYWMGHWALILGHRPRAVRDALAAQISAGWMYGTLNEQTMDLSAMISEAVPAAERLRYVASGTEAAMYAVRLARAATSRKIIAKVDGGWHGYTSDLLKTINWPFSEPESTGMVNDDQVVSIPYNDIDGSISILERVKGDLAGIIIEPVLGGGGCIPAEVDYLRGMQEFAVRNGSLFMLDEIVTGFRLGYGCAYQTMGVDPDLVTLGKIVGGGMPIGVVCGREEIMRMANTSQMSRTDRCYVGGGTFSANPMSMVAGMATLRTLKESPQIYDRIGRMGDRIRDDVARILGDRVDVTGMGSLFMTHFLAGGVDSVNNAAQAAKCDQSALRDYHMHLIANDGIFFLPCKLGAVSAAHTHGDVRGMRAATERFASGALKS